MMKKSNKYIDLVRVICCLAIFLYHLGILKGGYLAVCTFFVLTGYLSCIQASKKEKFSLKEYYLNRIIKIYVPLLIVVFLTVFCVSLFTSANWLNLKPETTSVLLGYNNYWQLSANANYFAQHVSSPFMHFWYMGILLQFELVFPFIFLLFKKIGEKTHRSLPCVLSTLLGIIGVGYFYYVSVDGNMMFTYYDTFARSFSLILGVALGFIHDNYHPLVPRFFNKDKIKKIIFGIYLVLLGISFYYIDAASSYFVYGMIGVTFASMRLIDYSYGFEYEKISWPNRLLNNAAKMSYLVYLVQYPVIFFIDYIAVFSEYRILGIVVVTLTISFILYVSLHIGVKSKARSSRYIVLLILLHMCCYGAYIFSITEDHTEEMRELESQLEKNAQVIEAKREEYENRVKQENDDWLSTLTELDNAEASVAKTVHELSLTGVGDSVMLGAIDNLYAQFPNGYFDAKISRSMWAAKGILLDLKNSGSLSKAIVLNLGANGNCSAACKEEIIEMCEGRDVFWLTVTNDKSVYVNDKLKALANEHDNLHIIDWENISKGHSEYFYSDGIHLTPQGRVAYTKAIYDAIYQKYMSNYNDYKQGLIAEHDKKEMSKITFYGNDLLTGAFNQLHANFSEAKFNTDKNYDFETLKKSIVNSKDAGEINHNVVFVFDENIKMSKEQYKEIIALLEGHNVYVVSAYKYVSEISGYLASENVHIIDFLGQIKTDDDYFLADKVHLSKSGNKALAELIEGVLTKNV